eukprot:6042000-Pyramimonas_sp.AAC.1
MKLSHKAVVDWDRRWIMIRMFVVKSQPDILVFQEMDHMVEAQEHLAALGYECALAAGHNQVGTEELLQPQYTSLTSRCSKYVPAHTVLQEGKKDAVAYLKHLRDTAVAFAPKTSSNCRKFGLKSQAGADDDGVAIFWRNDTFDVLKLDFLAFDDPKRNQGAVR